MFSENKMYSKPGGERLSAQHPAQFAAAWVWLGFRFIRSLRLTIWKNNTSPQARILSPFRTPPNASTLLVASFLVFFGVLGGFKVISGLPRPYWIILNRSPIDFEVFLKNMCFCIFRKQVTRDPGKSYV